MTEATYDFNLSAVQSSASSMIVELQPDTTSATPGTDARWQGGVRPRITLNWAAGVKLAQGTVNTAGNTTVDGNAVYKWVKISSTPSDLTLDTSALPTVTMTDDDSGGGGGQTMTFIYGPADNAGDSLTQNIGSRQQQCGRTWRSGAPRWKVVLGQTEDGNGRTGLQMLFKDDAGALDYFPVADNQAINANTVTVAYTGASPSATEPYTYVRINPDLSIDCCCATTMPTASKPKGDNERILVTIDKGVWDRPGFWGSQIAADRVPSTYAQSNAEAVVANGIYAARLGAIQ